MLGGQIWARTVSDPATTEATACFDEQGRLERAVIDLLRAELRGCLTPTQASAFQGTIFE
jgi:hypothetical protein